MNSVSVGKDESYSDITCIIFSRCIAGCLVFGSHYSDCDVRFVTLSTCSRRWCGKDTQPKINTKLLIQIEWIVRHEKEYGTKLLVGIWFDRNGTAIW